MKFSVFGGKKEDEVDEKALEEVADRVAAEMAPEADYDQGEGVGAYDEIRERVEDLQARLEQLDSSTGALRSEMGQFEQRFAGMETNIRELLSLYELATKSQNPFFQDDSPEGASNPPKEGAIQQPPTKEGSPLSIPSPPEPEDTPPKVEHPKPRWDPGFRPGLPKLDVDGDDFDQMTVADLDNSPETNMLILRWIEYIMQQVGYTGISSTLDYYVQIGWMTREAAQRILSFSMGIDLRGSGAKPPKKSTLSVREHLVSLYFVTRLKKQKVFDNIYLSVRDEVEKLGLSLSEEGV